MAPYRKVNKGDPLNFPAGLQNDLIDLLSANQAGQGLTPGLVGAAAQGVVVMVRNTSGSDRRRWDTMSLSTTLRFTLGPDGKESVIFNAQTSDPSKPAAILQEPIPVNKTGRALIFGYTLARVVAGSATTFAAKPNASHKLAVDASGSVRLLAAASASAETIVPVILGFGSGGFSIFRYTLTSNMGSLAGPGANCSVIELGVSGASTLTGQTIVDPIGLGSFQMAGGRGLCWRGVSSYFVLVPECEGEEITTPTSSGPGEGA